MREELIELRNQLSFLGLHKYSELLDNYIKKYVYRYLIIYKQQYYSPPVDDNINYPHTDFIKGFLYDGSYSILQNESLLKFHQTGKPKKLAIKWHIKKSEYTAYFWFEDEKICSIFERFYGAHPDTKTDFIIRIDAEKKKFELSLFRQGLKEPQIIPEDAYQLLIFKNKFEYHRSENYNQERGAWIW